jgi:hypothetical protein
MGDYDDNDDMPQIEAQDETVAKEAPSGALPQTPEAPTADPMGEVMGAAGQAAPEIARIATRYGITEGDPAWVLALAVRDACAAGDNAAMAAGRIEDATRGVSETIYNQTLRAGEDLKGLVASGIRETTLDIGKKIGRAIEIVTQRGADKITSAANDLDQIAHDKIAGMIQEYKGHLAKAARQEAERRSIFTGAVRWGVVASVIFGSLIFGVVNGWLGYRYTHITDLTPSNMRIYRQPNGAYIVTLNGRFGIMRIACKKTLCLRITP